MARGRVANLKPWRKGQSGNPGGRPKTKYLSEAYRRILDDRGADEFAETIAHDALNADRPRDRLAAVQEITDRTEGRAVQAVKVEAEMDEAAARCLFDLAERLRLLGDDLPTRDAAAPALPALEVGDKLLD